MYIQSFEQQELLGVDKKNALKGVIGLTMIGIGLCISGFIFTSLEYSDCLQIVSGFYLFAGILGIRAIKSETIDSISCYQNSLTMLIVVNTITLAIGLVMLLHLLLHPVRYEKNDSEDFFGLKHSYTMNIMSCIFASIASVGGCLFEIALWFQIKKLLYQSAQWEIRRLLLSG
jgi:hypothetical protein